MWEVRLGGWGRRWGYSKAVRWVSLLVERLVQRRGYRLGKEVATKESRKAQTSVSRTERMKGGRKVKVLVPL